jgi:hypothetical protein
MTAAIARPPLGVLCVQHPPRVVRLGHVGEIARARSGALGSRDKMTL